MSERTVQQPIAAERQAKFTDLPSADMERSTFDMSHSWKGTFDAGIIAPVMLQEILPGDTFNVATTAFMRLATPIKPIMDGITADIHYFFVPNRLVWDNWQFFMGERAAPDDDPTTLAIPTINIPLDVTTQGQTPADFFGLPMQASGAVSVNTLPFRGINLIWNEWYRNQNLNFSLVVPTDDGPDTPEFLGLNTLLVRHKRADYFTRALPWPQKGDPVYLPLGIEAPVVPNDGTNYFINSTDQSPIQLRAGNAPDVGYDGTATAQTDKFFIDAHADLTTATAATINDIRTAFQIQKLLERDARSGTRYIEIILAHFNVQSPDFRLQRPEYIGGGSGRITINPVASTANVTDAPQANLAATGTGVVKARMNHSFTEHGYLFALMSTRSDLTYQNGIERHWARQTRYDYYWPALSHLGEQAIYNKEIFFDPALSDNDDIWGFQERYAEYRYSPGRITGKFRSNDPESLDIWHLAQDFDTRPELASGFNFEGPPVDRVIAVPSEPHFLVDCWHEVQATRPMPVYAVPGLVDHF